MKPTNDDLARLISDARREHDAAPPLDESPGPMAADAVDALKTLLLLVAAPAVKWHEVRALALQALYLCALIAWEAGQRMAPAMLVNDGKGGLRPLDPLTAAETPAAKHDVEALLKEAEARPIIGAELAVLVSPAVLSDLGIARRLAAALRAALERVEGQTRRADANFVSMLAAHEHLLVVLDWGWPDGTTWPEPVRLARAFLAGEALAPHRDDAREIELLRKELADKGAALERMVDRFHAAETGRRQAVSARDTARADHRAEDEAHAHTMSMLADAKGGLAAAGREVERLQGVAREALAAQNRAESERDAVRAEHVALVAGIEKLVAQMPKGKA